MCYDAAYLLARQIKDAIHQGAPKEDIEDLKKELGLYIEENDLDPDKIWPILPDEGEDDDLGGEENPWPGYYHVNGFSHPPKVAITQVQPTSTVLAEWGFVPPWVKTVDEAYNPAKPYNNNLNAQSGTMFEKKAFANAAKYCRCVVLYDAYYEHHDQKSKKYPFRIMRKDEKPMYIGAIYRTTWLVDEDSGEQITKNTLATLTCEANPLLSKIHNNPAMIKRTGHSRMLVILEEDQLEDFLSPYPIPYGEKGDPGEEKLFQQKILNLCQPYDQEKLKAYTVRNLRPRKDTDYLGNTPEITEEFLWDTLDYRKFDDQ